MSSDALAAAPVGSGTFLRFLPQAIRVPRRPLVAIGVGWLTSFPVAVVLAIIAGMIFPHAPQPDFKGGPALVLFLVVIFSPVVETLIMGSVLLVLLRFIPETAAILVSAVGWGIAHSLLAPTWGMTVWWPFLILSTLFVTWRKRSLTLAFVLPICVHAMQNLLPALMVVSGKHL